MIKIILSGICHVLCINCRKLIVKTLSQNMVCQRVIVDSDKYIFPWKICSYYIKKVLYKAILFKYNE